VVARSGGKCRRLTKFEATLDNILRSRLKINPKGKETLWWEKSHTADAVVFTCVIPGISTHFKQ
jgi:hypothetical protein